MLSEEEKLKLITKIVRVETLKEFNQDSCVASTRILTDVLHYFGYPSEPLPVTVLAANAVAWEQMQQGVPMKEWPAEAWSIGVGGTGVSQDKRWDGHLVAIVDGKWLVDPSLDQASRPHRNINLEPSVLDASQWIDKKTPNAWLDDDTKSVLIYQQMLTPGNWRNAPDWSLRKPKTRASVRAAVGASIRILKPVLAMAS